MSLETVIFRILIVVGTILFLSLLTEVLRG